MAFTGFLFTCRQCHLLLKDAVVLDCGHSACVYCSMTHCAACQASVTSRRPNLVLRALIAQYCAARPELAVKTTKDDEKIIYLKAEWTNGHTYSFGIYKGFADGLILLTSLWSLGTVLRGQAAHSRSAMRLSYRNGGENEQLTPVSKREAYYWNIPADLFPSLTNPDGVIRGGGWETIIKLLVQVTITVNNHKLFKDNHVIGKDYPSIAAVKAFLAQWNLDNTCQFNAQELFFWSMFLGSTPV